MLRYAFNYYKSVVNKIPFSDIFVHIDGLREESFKYLAPFFENSNNFPPALKPVELSVFEDNKNKILVQDGRHRLLLSRKYGIEEVPGVLRAVDLNGSVITESRIIINMRD